MLINKISFPGLNLEFDIDPVAFKIFGGKEVYWYGIIIVTGLIIAVLLALLNGKKVGISADNISDYMLITVPLAIIGARLYYCIFEWDRYKDNPADIIKIWEGGLAIYGGIIGGIAAAFVVCKVRKLNFYNLLDLAGMSLLIGQGIGRWGNYANQEAFGTNTDLPWGMWSAKTALYINNNQALFAEKGIEMDPNLPVHPTFLYESIWCILGFFVLYIITKKFRRFSGQTFLCYGVWYGTGRMIIEGFRTDSLYVGNTSIRVSQLLSAAIVLVCLAALIALTVKYKKNPKPIDGIDYFSEEESAKVSEEESDEQSEYAVETQMGEENNDEKETL